MAIQSIISQPATNGLAAAYRPVILRVSAKATGGDAKPPVVYCDIYLNGIFYKTITKTQYSQLNTADSEWQFDIQDAAQEFLGKFLGDNGGSEILEALPVLAKTLCKFRSSGYDANGFIVPEGTPPIQGTGGSDPVAGTGTASNEFYIANATLQHKDNQDLASHLNAYKTGSWSASCYPLTHRPAGYKMGLDDSDYFPALIGADICLSRLNLKYRLKGESTFYRKWVDVSQPCDVTIKGIKTNQAGGTQNVTVSWNAAAGATGYVYRIDAGPWIANAGTSVTVNDLSIANHTVDVAAVCECSQGNYTRKTFTVEDPVDYTCSTVVSDVAVTQTGDGTATLTFTSTGAAPSWKYSLDGGPDITINDTTRNLTGLSIGSHSITVTPVCTNGVSGTSDDADFDIVGMPKVTKVSETDTGPGGTRTQVFEIGGFVTPGNKYYVGVYSHDVTVTAVTGDDAASIAAKMRDAINNTTTAEWDEVGSAPPSGTTGYPPTATSSGNQFTITLNWGNSFSYGAQLN